MGPASKGREERGTGKGREEEGREGGKETGGARPTNILTQNRP